MANIKSLEEQLAVKHREYADLQTQRNSLLNQLTRVDRKLARVTGEQNGALPTRTTAKAQSKTQQSTRPHMAAVKQRRRTAPGELRTAITKVLPKRFTIPELIVALRKSGVKTNAPAFATSVRNCLITHKMARVAEKPPQNGVSGRVPYVWEKI